MDRCRPIWSGERSRRTRPWVLDRAEIGWWAEAAPLRRLARQQVPNLISPSRLPPGRRGLTVVARLGGAVVPWYLAPQARRAPAVTPPSSRSACAAPPRRSDRRSSSSARSSRRAKGSVPAGARRRVQAVSRPGAGGAVRRRAGDGRGRPRTTARRRVRLLRRRSRSPRRRSPRSTPPACARARTWSSRCNARTSPASCTTTCGRWPGWRRTSSGASLSPRWPTRRRSSSCSPTPSSRSSTSASRPPTCSTSPGCCASSARPATWCRDRIRRWSPAACS